MTPSNPSNNQPLIYRIADSLGVLHLVTAFNHTHSQDEVSGLVSALAGKQATLTFDNEPTSGSNNPVKSGGIFTALAAKLQKLTSFTTGNFPKIKSDGTLEDSGKNASDFAEASHEHNRIVNTNHTASVTAGNNAAGSLDLLAGTYIKLSIGTTGQGGSTEDATITSSNIDNLNRALETPDSTPTASSDKLVTSGGIYTALGGKLDSMTIDQSPTNNTDHLISSKGVKDALAGKAPKDKIEGNGSQVMAGYGNEPVIYISVDGGNDDPTKETEITQSNIANLKRALEAPASPASGGNKLITNGQVYTALGEKADSTHTHLPSEVYGLFPTYIDFDGSALDLDGLVDDEWGMNRVIVKNESNYDTTFAALFYSGTDLPVHLNGNGSAAIADGYYALCTIYKIDKDMNDSDSHEHDLCYFVTLDGIFDSGN